jgi:hypothetical protein
MQQVSMTRRIGYYFLHDRRGSGDFTEIVSQYLA